MTKICDKCKGKSEYFKDFGIHGQVVFQRDEADTEKETVELCQECYSKVYVSLTGEPLPELYEL